MGSQSTASLAPFIAVLNLLFFSLANACASCPAPAPSPQYSSSPNPKPSSNSIATCPRDALTLGVCANVLRSMLNVEVGHPPVKPCCSLLFGLVDLEAAVCLCTAIKANVLGINLNIPVALSLLLNVCGDKVPKGFQCA